jgi:Formin N-terminal GTPase-binding domain
MDEELVTFRVQYLVDQDPFNSSLSSYPVPSRAPVFSFVVTTPLVTQLGALLRLLGAPQRVRTQSCHACLMSESHKSRLRVELSGNYLGLARFRPQSGSCVSAHLVAYQIDCLSASPKAHLVVLG